jgi:hypothetical protein
MSDDERSKHGCLRAIAWGCGCLVLGVVMMIAAAYLGRDLIKESDWFKSAKGAAEQAVAVSEEVERRFPADDISIGTHTKFGTDAGRSLTIRVLNPLFEIPDGEGEVVAREIAAFAASRFPSIGEFDTVAVEIHVFRDGFSSQQRFSFAVADLVPGVAAPEDAQGAEVEL